MPPSQTLTALHAKVEAVTNRLVKISQRIQATTADNDRLRRDLAELQQQVMLRSKAQMP